MEKLELTYANGNVLIVDNVVDECWNFEDKCFMCCRESLSGKNWQIYHNVVEVAHIVE